MTKRTPRPRLSDILDFIGQIEKYCHDRVPNDLATDRYFRDAVERNIEKISEAASHISEEDRTAHAATDWRGVELI